MSALHRTLLIAFFAVATGLLLMASGQMDFPPGFIPVIFAVICAGLATLVTFQPTLVDGFLKEGRDWMKKSNEAASDSASGECGLVVEEPEVRREKKPSRVRRWLDRHPHYSSKRHFGH